MDLSVHRSLEFIVGAALFAVPLVVSATSTQIGAAGLVVSVSLGAVLVGIAIGSDIRVRPHAAFDRVFVVTLLIAALLLVLLGEGFAALCCLVAAVAELALLARTRYVIRSRGV